MGFYTSRLIGREWVAHETLAVTLARPDGFSFSAGQYVDVTLNSLLYQDDLGPIRSFSIASAPEEQDLLLVMRMRDTAFKRTLVALPLDTEVRFEGPIDDMAFSMDGGRPLVFLAGGVGVVPFLSGLRERASKGLPCDVTLFYSNARPEDAAYLDELTALTDRIPGYRLVPTMTRMAESSAPWNGETGRMNVPMFERHLPTLAGAMYYLSGSPSFISSLRMQLQRAGVPPKDIEIELFTGY